MSYLEFFLVPNPPEKSFAVEISSPSPELPPCECQCRHKLGSQGMGALLFLLLQSFWASLQCFSSAAASFGSSSFFLFFDSLTLSASLLQTLFGKYEILLHPLFLGSVWGGIKGNQAKIFKVSHIFMGWVNDWFQNLILNWVTNYNVIWGHGTVLTNKYLHRLTIAVFSCPDSSMTTLLTHSLMVMT